MPMTEIEGQLKIYILLKMPVIEILYALQPAQSLLNLKFLVDNNTLVVEKLCCGRPIISTIED